MEQILRTFTVTSALVLLLVSAATAAVGIGPYVDLAGGVGELERDNGGPTWDVVAATGAVGFVLDTAPTGPATFNYRLNVGLESQSFEDEDNDDNVLDVGGLVVENIFGFSIVRKPTLRWWVGPLVRFGFYSGETDNYFDFATGDRRKLDDVKLFEFGVGAATGVNIPLGKSRKLILAPSAGVRFIGVNGEGTFRNYSAGTAVKEDLSGSFTTAFINCALLF